MRIRVLNVVKNYWRDGFSAITFEPVSDVGDALPSGTVIVDNEMAENVKANATYDLDLTNEEVETPDAGGGTPDLPGAPSPTRPANSPSSTRDSHNG